MTIQQFTQLHNARRAALTPPRPPDKFSIEKSKVLKKRVDTYVANEHRIPQLIHTEPAVSKRVFDTNGFGKLIQAMWFFFIGTQMKRISSEGSYRPGIGFIKSPNKGIGDFMAPYKGITYFVETKQLNESYLKSQKRFKLWADDGGVPYVTLRSFEGMWEFLCEIKPELKELYP